MPSHVRSLHNFKALSKPKPLKKHDHRHYWPYIPVLLLVIGTFMMSLMQPIQRRGVLAYATSMNNSALLNATNQHRATNGSAALQLNSQLSAAAQAKANDMIARNYWSHNTPDGQEPWVFVKNAGYNYQKAGENLAYGFDTSEATVVGWMNSPTHKSNMLDTTFTEVGFGYANGASYNQNGQQTVVVAMYGKPQVLASNGNNPAPAAQPAPTPKPVASAPAPTPAVPAAEVAKPTEKPTEAPVTTDKPVTTEPSQQAVSRINSLTNGNLPWVGFAVGIVTGLALMGILVRHAAGVRHLLRDGEKFIMHHPLLDTVLVSLVLVGTFLSQTTGFIR